MLLKGGVKGREVGCQRRTPAREPRAMPSPRVPSRVAGAGGSGATGSITGGATSTMVAGVKEERREDEGGSK